MATVSLRQIGSLGLDQLIGMHAGLGDGVPYPLWRTRREPYWGQIEKRLRPFPQRFAGDLEPFQDWVRAYAEADIWVECRVNSWSADTPDIRLLAHRAGEAGFLASQRPDADVVDVYGLSPIDLGTAIAASVKLIGPGTRAGIALPGFLENFMDKVDAVNGTVHHELDDEDDYGVTFSARRRPNYTIIDSNDVTLLATVQSRCQTSDVRDVDWARDVVVWVRIAGDGDYVYTPDRSHAVPATPQILRERIDQLIAADVVSLRRQRGPI